MEGWITTTEAAKISGFHVEHIRRLIRKDIITARKWGREWMVSQESLVSYLNEERKPGPKPKKIDSPKP